MKLKRYHIIFFLLVIYSLFMLLYFGLDLLKEGQSARFWITLGVDLLVLIGAFFALRRRDRLREQKKKDPRNF